MLGDDISLAPDGQGGEAKAVTESCLIQRAPDYRGAGSQGGFKDVGLICIQVSKFEFRIGLDINMQSIAGSDQVLNLSFEDEIVVLFDDEITMKPDQGFTIPDDR